MVMTMEEEEFTEAFINGTGKRYPFMAPIECSVQPVSNEKLFPFSDRHSGPRIFDTKKLRELIGDPDRLNFRYDSFFRNKSSSGSSLYEAATEFSAQLEGSGPIKNIAMVTIEAEFDHKITNSTLTSFAKVDKKIGRGRYNGPNAIGNQSGRDMIRKLLLPAVKSEVDNIKSRAEAQDFVRRYGPAIVGTAQFGGAISVYTKSSMNKKENSTSMAASLSAEVDEKKLNAGGGLSFGRKTSTEDNSFSYEMSAYGGNTNLLLDVNDSNVMKRWADSMSPDDDRFPMSIIDMSFNSISVLAEWGSTAEHLLEWASAIEISLMDERLRKMFVEKPINVNVRKNILYHNDNRKEMLITRKVEYQGKVDRWWETAIGARKWRNGIWACNECFRLLDEFNALVKRPDRSGESIEAWATEKLKFRIRTEFPKNWGNAGDDARQWNSTWKSVEIHWEWLIRTNNFETRAFK